MSSHLRLGLPSSLLPWVFPTPTLCSPVLYLYALMPRPSHSSWCDHANNSWWGLQFMKLLFMQSSPLPCYSFPYGPNIFPTTTFSNTVSLYPSLSVTDHVSHSYKTTGKLIILYIWIFILFDSKERCVFSYEFIRQNTEPACSYGVMVRGITSHNVSVSTTLHDITSQKGPTLYPTTWSHSQRQSLRTRVHGVTSHNW